MWLKSKLESVQRNVQIEEIVVLNVPPPPKICDIDKKYRDPTVSIYSIRTARYTVHNTIFNQKFNYQQRRPLFVTVF